MKPDKQAADQGEPIAFMEPLLFHSDSRHRAALTDLAFDLTQKSAGFRRSLPPCLISSLADLVRAMNCYYSNLIEGHDTHPIDIERALKNDFSNDTRQRDLQREANAHIAVQFWIDEGGLKGRAATEEGILEIHQRFYALVPDELVWVEDPVTKKRLKVEPGKLRKRAVQVGQHIAVSAGALPRFMQRFESVYGKLGKVESILSSAAAHHRLVWMHPFLDGNGRVARLMSHAMLLETLDTGAIWSIARGLARNAAQYKSLLAKCDLKRRNDLDGRGTLSEEALAEFTRFFLTICIDQVTFMENLVQPDRLRTRVLMWAEEDTRLGKLPQHSGRILESLLYRGGELPRSETAAITGTGERQTRRVIAALADQGVIVSSSPRSPLRLAFPATLASRWMPGLFPDYVQ